MAPLAWVRRIASENPELNTVPLFGKAPPFDWGHFSHLLASRFKIANLKIQAREQAWREGGEIKKGIGTDLIFLPITIAPLGTVFWILSRADLTKLTSALLKPGNKNNGSCSELLQEGFYRYCVLEALHAIQGMQPLENLTLQISEEELLLEKAFCIDVETRFEEKSAWGRLVIPTEFRTAWVQHFSRMPSEYISTEIARQTQLVLGVKTGSVALSQEEWNDLQIGDFLALDQGSYDPFNETGVALLMLQSTPVFNVKMKRDQIELTDYAFYYEDTMENKGDSLPEDKLFSEASEAADEGEVVALKKLPLHVSVEVARLKITLDQLMHLTPGNTLELPIHPDQPVSLTINGQTVGKGELVYLGEQLGVRILEIG